MVQLNLSPTDKPGGRGKAAGLAVKRHKLMNNNQNPRVEFRRGLLKPVGPWAAVFASETTRILRMNAPLAIRKWRKVDPGIKRKNNHCCGSKPFVRIREEMKDQGTQEEPGGIAMYHHTRFSKKKGRWVSPAAEENYNMMNTLQSAPTPYNSTPLTEDQVLGKRHGLVHGQDPLPTSTLDELDNVEEARRFAEEAERRAEEVERHNQDAQERFEESERRRDESERWTDEKIQAMKQQMLNFMAQFQPPNPSMMDLLMGGIGSMVGIGGMGGMGSN